MRFRDAMKLHKGDKVTVKRTNETVNVLNVKQVDTTARLFIECDNGKTYVNLEVK